MLQLKDFWVCTFISIAKLRGLYIGGLSTFSHMLLIYKDMPS